MSRFNLGTVSAKQRALSALLTFLMSLVGCAGNQDSLGRTSDDPDTIAVHATLAYIVFSYGGNPVYLFKITKYVSNPTHRKDDRLAICSCMPLRADDKHVTTGVSYLITFKSNSLTDYSRGTEYMHIFNDDKSELVMTPMNIE